MSFVDTDSVDNGQLKSMRQVAHYVNTGILEIEKALTSVDGLMPDDFHQPQSLELMNEVLQEVKDLEEHSHQMKVQLQRLLDCTNKQNESARAANKAMEENITQIEETLRNFGYDGSLMPAFNLTEENTTGPYKADESIHSVSEEESFEDEEDGVSNIPDQKVSAALSATPLKRDMSTLNESMAGVEITPFFPSKSSLSRNTQSRSPLACITPCRQKLSHSENYASKSCTPYKSPSTIKLSVSSITQKGAKSEEAPKLVIPTRPVFSRETLEILGRSE